MTKFILTEAVISDAVAEQKMTDWHKGKCNENIKACGNDKLLIYFKTCRRLKFVKEAKIILAEAAARGLHWGKLAYPDVNMTTADLDFYRVVDAITPNFLRHLLETEKSSASQALSNWLSWYGDACNLSDLLYIARNIVVAKMLGCETVVNCAKKGIIDAGGGQLLKQILDASCNKTTMEALDKQVNGILYGDTTLKELIPGGKIIESIVNNLTENIEKHDELNPKLWVDNSLKTEVRAKILEISNEFIKALQRDGIKFNLNDIQIVGSNCSYNYTKDSDLDVHLIADSSSLNCPDNLYPLLYSSYRSIFNKNLSIDFYGIPVELYIEVESGKAPTNAKSNGIYSVLSNKWIKEPIQADIPNIDQEKFDTLLNGWKDRYFKLTNDKTDSELSKVTAFIDELYNLRQSSIIRDGEYGLGNLIFKEFRNLGYLDNLKDLRNKLLSQNFSL